MDKIFIEISLEEVQAIIEAIRTEQDVSIDEHINQQLLDKMYTLKDLMTPDK